MPRKNRIAIALVACAGALLLAAPGLAAEDLDMGQLLTSWQSHYNSGDFAGLAGLYAEDGCRMPPNQETVNGREAIQASLVQGHEQGIAGVKLALTMSDSSGDIGHATGRYVILDADGERVDQGKWMNIVQRTESGWEIRCDIWNSDRPLPADDDDEEDDD